MKTLLLCSDLKLIGGIEKYNRDLISSLEKCGTSIKIVQRYQGGLFQKIIFTIKAILSSISFKPDYIICCHVNFSPILIFLNNFKKIKFSISIYGIEAIEKFSNLKMKALHEADKILTISNYTKNLIKKQNVIFEKKILVIKSCVNENLFIKNNIYSLKKKYNLNNKRVLITLSRMSSTEEKGHNRVLESLLILEKKFQNFIYMIVGGGHDGRIDEILNENENLRKKVIFTGPIDDDEKFDYLSLGDIFILPSKNEGFAIVFLEALMAGLIVIAPDKYGCPEGLLNGQLGVLIDVERKDLIAKKIESIFLNKISKNLQNKKLIRSKAINIYGIKRWDKEVKEFYNLISKSL